jgi:MFS family permease
MLLAWGTAFLVAADVVLAFASGPVALALGVALWGLHMGLTQGLLAAMVAATSPDHLRGTGFGVFNLASGVAMLAASAIAGALWHYVGPAATFWAGAALAAAPPWSSPDFRVPDRAGVRTTQPGRERLGGQRRCHEIALHLLAAALPQEFELVEAIHALRDRRDAHVLREVDDRRHDREMVRIAGMSRTNVRSILSLSMGKRFRFMSDECPVPKSSIASLTPRVFSAAGSSQLGGVAEQHALGELEAQPLGLQLRFGEHALDLLDEIPLRNCIAERFTATGSFGRPASCHARFCRHAWRSTHAPMRMMRPRCSATGMNSPGSMKPPPSCGQRMSASMP